MITRAGDGVRLERPAGLLFTVDSPVTAELLAEIAQRIGARDARAADLNSL